MGYFSEVDLQVKELAEDFGDPFGKEPETVKFIADELFLTLNEVRGLLREYRKELAAEKVAKEVKEEKLVLDEPDPVFDDISEDFDLPKVTTDYDSI